MGTLNCTDMTSGMKQHQPASPTASFSESNIVASSTDPEAVDALAGLQELRFDEDIDGEIHSPDIAMWETLCRPDRRRVRCRLIVVFVGP